MSLTTRKILITHLEEKRSTVAHERTAGYFFISHTSCISIALTRACFIFFYCANDENVLSFLYMDGRMSTRKSIVCYRSDVERARES